MNNPQRAPAAAARAPARQQKTDKPVKNKEGVEDTSPTPAG